MCFKTPQLGILLLIISICVTRATCSSESTFIDELSPINIDTSKVEFISKASNPFTVEVTISDLFVISSVKNTGKEILFDDEKYLTVVKLSGGLLPNGKTYRLGGRFLLLNQNGSRNRSGHIIDGSRYLVEGVNIFFDENHRSLKNATNYEDGLLFLSQPVDVKKSIIPNPLFFPMERILRSGALEKPNSEALLPVIPSFAYYDSIFISRAYFLYKTRNALYMVTQPPYNYISEYQFEAFKNVLGFDGKPLNTIAPLDRSEGIKIEASSGIRVKVFPLVFPIYLP